MAGRASECLKAAVFGSSIVLGCLAASLTPAAATSLYDITALPTVELQFGSDDWWAELLANRATGALAPVRLRFDGAEFPTAGARFHGRSSFGVHEVSKKVPFWIAVDVSQEGRTLDGRRTLILKNNFSDPSLLREVLALRILGEVLPAPRASFVKLVINGESWGVYTNVELPDREFFARWFDDATGPIHIGERPFYLVTLKAGRCRDVFPPVGSDGVASCAAIRRLLEIKDEAEPEKRRELLPELLDVDRALRHMAAETAIGHTDGFPANNYTLYQDPSSGRFVTVPWDYDLSFQFPELKLLPPQRGMLTDPTWYRRYAGYVRTIIEDSLDWERIGPWVRAVHRLIDGEVRRDDKSLIPYELFVRNATSTVAPLPGSSYTRPGIEEFVERRRRWLRSSGLAKELRVSLTYREPVRQPGAANRPASICLSVGADGAPVARVLVHLDDGKRYREIELRDDGEGCDEGSGDGIHSVAIGLPASGPEREATYYFSAEDAAGDVSFLPRTGGFRPYRLAAPAQGSLELEP